jgi:hypothetical protein
MKILVIFVSSEGKVPQTLFTRSVASRMKRYRIGELNREEADHYLQKVKGIEDKITREKILDVIGYTFQYLNLANYGIEIIQEEVSQTIEGYLREVDLDRWYSDKNIVKVIKEILEHGKVTEKEYFAIMTDDEKAKKILEGNVFTTRRIISEPVVCFQNTATRNYFARMIAGLDREKAVLESKKKGWLW